MVPCNSCTAACSGQSVGVTDSSIIPDYRFSASSSRGGNEPSKGRLRGSKAWVPSSNNKADDYLQIDLRSVYIVCAVETQGNPSSNEWTKTYKVKTSFDNVKWTTYREGNTEKVAFYMILSLMRMPRLTFLRFYCIKEVMLSR